MRRNEKVEDIMAASQKVALVTGAGTGIGKAVSLALALGFDFFPFTASAACFK